MCEEFYLQTLKKKKCRKKDLKRKQTKIKKQNLRRQSRASIFSAPLEIKMLHITF